MSFKVLTLPQPFLPSCRCDLFMAGTMGAGGAGVSGAGQEVGEEISEGQKSLVYTQQGSVRVKRLQKAGPGHVNVTDASVAKRQRH